jgi:hypothetical protein
MISAAQVQLLWSDPGGFKDGYKSERSLDGVSFTPIATIGAAAPTYLDAGLAPSVKYYYCVRSYAGPSNSAYSNTATVTTAGTPGTLVRFSAEHWD